MLVFEYRFSELFPPLCFTLQRQVVWAGRKAEPSHRTEGTHFGCLYLWSPSSHHYRQLMTTGEGWNLQQLVNGELCLLAQLSLFHNSPEQYAHHPDANPPSHPSFYHHTHDAENLLQTKGQIWILKWIILNETTLGSFPLVACLDCY